MSKVKRSWGGIALGLAVLALLLTAAAPRASADSFTLSVPNSAISAYPAGYINVTVTLVNSTTATITFTNDPSGIYNYLMGDGSTAAVNVNATTFTVGAVSESNSLGAPFTPTFTSTQTGTQNVDGFGDFNLTINNTDGFGDSATTVTFTITNTSGTWSSAANVLIANSQGNTAAAHVFVESSTCTDGSGKLVACATGYAGNGTNVPEPGTLSIFGTGLLGLAGLIRRRMNKQA